MATFVPNLPALAAELRGVTKRPAEQIARSARRRYAQHELKTDDADMGVIVEPTTTGQRVLTRNPFAHFDEFGGTNVHSTPTGAMRSAAMEAGRFVPGAKP